MFDPEWPPAASAELPVAGSRGSSLSDVLWEVTERAAVTEENGGATWLALDLAHRWGIEGRDTERLAWVRDREEQWRRIAADPLNNTEWQSTPDPHDVGAF